MNDFSKKQEDLQKQAEEVEKEQKIKQAEQQVEDAKAGLEEAQTAAEDAMARDGGGVSVNQPGPEAERTRILAEQAERDLAEAESNLKNLREGKPAPEPEPLLQNADATKSSNVSSMNKAATRTDNVNH